tara:strand:+ start:1021 stop:1632 length:612 start_codon:yes stop_codon:yes gene_type:complete
MSIAIYIGAGNDMRPVNLFPNIKKFYYIDSQPFSHSGKEVYLRENGINGFSNPNFIHYVEKEFFKNNFKLTENKGNLKIYNRNDQNIHYFYNTSIPEDFEKIKNKIDDFSVVIDIGYHPNIKFLEANNKKLTFIGGFDTYYKDERLYEDYEKYGELHPNSLIQQFLKNNYHNRFKIFKYVDWGKIIEFSNWNDFYNYSIKNNN